ADRQRGGVAAVGADCLLGTGAAGGEYPDRPGARRGEEAESAVRTQRYLGDELPAVVQQPGIAHLHRGTARGYRALDDGLARGVLGHRDAARLPGPRPSPGPIGPPTRGPYSVQDPS